LPKVNKEDQIKIQVF